MKNISVSVYNHSEDLPEMEYKNFFHSKSLFRIYEMTAGYFPYMIVVKSETNGILCHLLAVIRRRGAWFPPYLYTQCRIYGEGDYSDDIENQHELFYAMLIKLTRTMSIRCLYIEISDMSEKMYGYKWLKKCGYFPIRWMEIHNSLHSKSPKELLSDRRIIRHINSGIRNGVTSSTVDSEEEFDQFYKMTKAFYKMRLRRFCPPSSFFRALLDDKENAKLIVTKYKKKIIGSCAIVFSEGNAYLWYAAYRSKSFPMQHPNTMTLWNALNYAYEHNYSHLFFMDVGLPFHNSIIKDMILGFGGKPVSTNRWFRCSIPWINNILSWLWRE